MERFTVMAKECLKWEPSTIIKDGLPDQFCFASFVHAHLHGSTTEGSRAAERVYKV